MMRIDWFFRVSVLVLLLSGSKAFGADTQIDCHFGGWTVGSSFSEQSEGREFPEGKTKFYKAGREAQVYRVDPELPAGEGCDPDIMRVSGGTSCSEPTPSASPKGREYIVVVDDLVVAFIREIPLSDTQQYVLALEHRYGSPATTFPEGHRMAVGAYARVDKTRIWVVRECGFMAQVMQRKTALGNLVSERSAVVVSVLPPEEEADEILD